MHNLPYVVKREKIKNIFSTYRCFFLLSQCISAKITKKKALSGHSEQTFSVFLEKGLFVVPLMMARPETAGPVMDFCYLKLQHKADYVDVL